MIDGDRLQTNETTVEVESLGEEEKQPHYHKVWMYNFFNPVKQLTRYRYKNGDRGANVIVDYLEGRDKSITLYMNGDGSSMKETFHPEHSNEGENVVTSLAQRICGGRSRTCAPLSRKRYRTASMSFS